MTVTRRDPDAPVWTVPKSSPAGPSVAAANLKRQARQDGGGQQHRDAIGIERRTVTAGRRGLEHHREVDCLLGREPDRERGRAGQSEIVPRTARSVSAAGDVETFRIRKRAVADSAGYTDPRSSTAATGCSTLPSTWYSANCPNAEAR